MSSVMSNTPLKPSSAWLTLFWKISDCLYDFQTLSKFPEVLSLPGGLWPWAGDDETVYVMGTAPVLLEVDCDVGSVEADVNVVVVVVAAVVVIFR